jgi:hypothetical protein
MHFLGATIRYLRSKMKEGPLWNGTGLCFFCKYVGRETTFRNKTFML